MARVEGIDPKQTSFLMRHVFKKVRKMLGRDITPQQIVARVPRVFWADGAAQWLLGENVVDAADCGAGRVPVLNRREFCRWQNVRAER